MYTDKSSPNKQKSKITSLNSINVLDHQFHVCMQTRRDALKNPRSTINIFYNIFHYKFNIQAESVLNLEKKSEINFIELLRKVNI